MRAEMADRLFLSALRTAKSSGSSLGSAPAFEFPSPPKGGEELTMERKPPNLVGWVASFLASLIQFF